MGKWLLEALCIVFLFQSPLMASTQKPLPQKSLDDWIEWVRPIAVNKMLGNISPASTAPGVVVASPSKENPDYFYHWVRDAGLVMDVLVSLYEKAEGENKTYYRNRLLDFVDFSLRNQRTPNKSGGVGEPKFLVTGDAFNEDWGRPQDDSPAIRALVFIRWARILLLEGQYDIVQQKLYTNGWNSVIKTDLEYISHNWRNTCFDLWEEIKGHHFFTRMVIRRALLDGAELAALMGDGGAAYWYRQQAGFIEHEISKHWNGDIIVSTINRDGGIDYKYSGLDSSVILGMLHGRRLDGFFPYSDERVMASAHKLEEVFQAIYSINQQGHRGTAIGRYPEDLYNGYSTSSGNPWFINTNAFAQYYFELSRELLRTKKISITDINRRFLASLWGGGSLPKHLNEQAVKSLAQRARQRGDDYLSTTQFHMAQDGSLSEQINRVTGFMQGAPDLTWSYASLLTALFARH